MAEKFIIIPNGDTQNYPFLNFLLKRLDTQPNEPTNHFDKLLKVVKTTNKKTLRSFRDYCNKTVHF